MKFRSKRASKRDSFNKSTMPISSKDLRDNSGHKRIRNGLDALFGGLKRNNDKVVTFRRVSARAVSSEKRSTTMLQQLVMDMRHCLEDLDATKFSDDDLENWAVLIFESMSSSSRVFHSVQHVFDVSEGVGEPLPILAAFFHDIIYYGIDGGLTPEQEEVLQGIIEEGPDGSVRLREKFIIPPSKKVGAEEPQTKDGGGGSSDQDPKASEEAEEEDVLIAAVASIFDFQPGQVLNPFLGLNEFLSAAFAVRCLRHCLPLNNLAVIATCIEATIPFRKPDQNGNTAPELLYQRLKITNEKFSMGMEDDDMIEAVQTASDLSNRDLRNFAQPSAASFLSNTWNLMHESNIDLRHTTVYRISSFALSLKKMCGFFINLDAGTLYSSFRGAPPIREVERLTKAAQHNIEIARRYLQAKLLSICVLAAFAQLTGGDAPIALFLGDLPDPNHPTSPGIEDFITPARRDMSIKINQTVYDILKNGREGGDTHFDLQNSPLAAYLYGMVGEKGLDRCLEHAVCPMDKENAKLLLDSLPRESVAYIATPCAILAESRKDRLSEIIKEYSD